MSKKNPVASRSSPRLKRTKSLSNTTVNDLILAGLVNLGEKLVFLNEEGFVTKDGWIEYNMKKFATLDMFCAEVFKVTGAPSELKKDYWDDIMMGDSSLASVRNSYFTMPASIDKKKSNSFVFVDTEDSSLDSDDSSSAKDISTQSELDENESESTLVVESESPAYVPSSKHKKKKNEKENKKEKNKEKKKEKEKGKGKKKKKALQKHQHLKSPSKLRILDSYSSQDMHLEEHRTPSEESFRHIEQPKSGLWILSSNERERQQESKLQRLNTFLDFRKENGKACPDFSLSDGESQNNRVENGQDEMELELIKNEMRSSSEIENNEMRSSSEISNCELNENNNNDERMNEMECEHQTPFEYRFAQSSKEESMSESESGQSTNNSNNMKRKASKTNLDSQWLQIKKSKVLKQASIDSLFPQKKNSSKSNLFELNNNSSNSMVFGQSSNPAQPAQTEENMISQPIVALSKIKTRQRTQDSFNIEPNPIKTLTTSTSSTTSTTSTTSTSNTTKTRSDLTPKRSDLQYTSSSSSSVSVSTPSLFSTTSTSTISTINPTITTKTTTSIPNNSSINIINPTITAKTTTLLNQNQIPPSIASQIPTSVSINNPNLSYKPVLLGSGLKKKMLEQLLVFTYSIGGILVNEWKDNVTHLIVQADDDNNSQRTLKYLFSIIMGIWIVDYSWVTLSLSSGSWLDESEFEVKGDTVVSNGAPKRSRELRLSKEFENKKRIDLFENLNFFFAYPKNTVLPSKKELEKLVLIAGGVLLEKAPKPPSSIQETMKSSTHIIVDKTTCTHEQIKLLFLTTGRYPINYLWILDSISNFKVLDFELYQLNYEDTHATFETQQSLAF